MDGRFKMKTNNLSYSVAIFLFFALTLIGCHEAGNEPDVIQTPPPELGPQIGNLASRGTYTTERSWFSGCIYNGHMYIVGGNDTPDYISSVEYASINSNGTVGSFSTTTSLPEGRSYHRCIGYKGYLYVISGFIDGNRTDTVLYAPVNQDGTLGAFQSTTAQLNIPRAGFAAAVHNDYLYVMGGSTEATDGDSVEYGAIAADGNITEFTTGNKLNTTRSFCSGAAHNGYLYVAGGRKSHNESYETVEYAAIQVDGSPGTFTIAAETVDTPREIFDVTVYNKYLYLIGGYVNGDTFALTDTIEYCELDAVTGAPGTFHYTDNALPNDLYHHTAQAYGDHLYVIGGWDTTDVLSAEFLE